MIVVAFRVRMMNRRPAYPSDWGRYKGCYPWIDHLCCPFNRACLGALHLKSPPWQRFAQLGKPRPAFRCSRFWSFWLPTSQRCPRWMACVELVYKTIRLRRCCLDFHASQFSLKWERHDRRRRSERFYCQWCRQEFFQCECQLSDQDSLDRVSWNAFSLLRQFQSSKAQTEAHCSPRVSSLQEYVCL